MYYFELPPDREGKGTYGSWVCRQFEKVELKEVQFAVLAKNAFPFLRSRKSVLQVIYLDQNFRVILANIVLTVHVAKNEGLP